MRDEAARRRRVLPAALLEWDAETPNALEDIHTHSPMATANLDSHCRPADDLHFETSRSLLK